MHVCIIGAGVIGMSTAFMLRQKGIKVTVLEAGPQVAGQTSFANGGQLSYSYVAPLADPGVFKDLPRWLLNKDSPLRFKPALSLQQWRWLLHFLKACRSDVVRRTTAQMLSLSYLSRDVLHDWQARFNLEFAHQRNGKLIVFRSPGPFEHAREQAQLQAELGSSQQVLEAAQVLELEPSLQALGSRLQGAIYTPSEEAGDACLFALALHERLQNDGDYELRLNTPVQRFVMEGRDIRAVHTPQGEFQADQFVLASGMGTVSLLRQLGGRPLIYPLKGYSLSLPLEGLNQAVPAISVTDYEQRIVYARLGKVLRMAAMVDIGFEGLDIPAARMATLKQQVNGLFPGLPLEQAQTWAGLRPATPSGKPVVGASKLAGRLWVNAGHGALGFTLACGSAAILAAHLTGEASPIDDAPFRP
ncbi:D-amino acid dehydrogenase [Alcaligenes ammonioxydans]|uniref:D-amino acid dehydrogenase n=1 Tax=Alcaligenes TaxID=507 RepID=UPI001F05D911|nr:D-amino acid dehydrogenase [Alcaligenes ammonioxydans]MCH1880142.1 D-amino acid dehydrogenase [Alcaligenes ammonioxydans]